MAGTKITLYPALCLMGRRGNIRACPGQARNGKIMFAVANHRNRLTAKKILVRSCW